MSTKPIFEKIMIRKTCGPLKAGLEIDFNEAVTVITGPQGCGKSTLLDLISGRNPKRMECIAAIYDRDSDGNIYHFDSEHDNPRMRKIDDWGADYNLKLCSRLESRHKSHGMTILDELSGLLGCVAGWGRPALVLMDEPESGLAMQSVLKLWKLTMKLAKIGQVIIVSHHPLLLSLGAPVFDLKKKEYIDGPAMVRKYLPKRVFK